MRTITFLVAVLAVTPLSTVNAQQQPPPVKVGERVLITAPDLGLNRYLGVLMAMDSATLTVDTLEVALTAMTRLEVSQGRTSGAGRGALTGGGIGLVTGAISGFLVGGLCYLGGGGAGARQCRAETTALGAGVLGVLGAVIGAAIGRGSESDRWEEVPLDQLSVSFVPQRDGRFGLGLSVAF